MRWIRHNTRICGALAIGALALQLILSFGHIHLDVQRDYQVGAGWSGMAPPSSPAQPGDDDDYCAICATIYLAANSFVPQAPQLPVPFLSRSIQHVDRAAAIFIAPRRAPFQSRAPPLA
jgi:hypothetical protein